ncbi:hypothetical protein CL622_03065 [archaeon]|nr:hypothetical protein [archaeon]
MKEKEIFVEDFPGTTDKRELSDFLNRVDLIQIFPVTMSAIVYRGNAMNAFDVQKALTEPVGSSRNDAKDYVAVNYTYTRVIYTKRSSGK